MSTESDEEVYGGRYSLESSPQDERVPNATAHRYGNPVQRQARYGSDYMYSDVSSSMETVVGRRGNLAERLVRGNGRYPVGRNGYTEDESSDSAASSEFSSTQVGSINGAVPRGRAYVSGGYASSVPSQANVDSAAEKVCKYFWSLYYVLELVLVYYLLLLCYGLYIIFWMLCV